MINTKRSLLTNATALLLCFIMLVGTTFAWFTDIAESKDNVIQSGRLDIALTKGTKTDAGWVWTDTDGQAIFEYEKWEPGYTTTAVLAVENHGTLSAKWTAKLELDGTPTILADVIDIYVTSYHNYSTDRPDFNDGTWQKLGTVREVLDNDGLLLPGETIDPGHRQPILVALKMRENAGNDYQDMDLGANFNIKILATQASVESDSYDNTYDADAQWPTIEGGDSASAEISNFNLLYGALTSTVSINGNGFSATIPADVKVANGATSLELTVKGADADANITLGEGGSATGFDVHIDGIAADNTQPMTVNLGAILPTGLSDTELKLYHTENGAPVLMTRVNSVADFSIHNQYTYNAETGEVSIYVASFSVFSAVKTTADEWDGTFDITWYDAKETEFTLKNAEQLAGFRVIVDGGYYDSEWNWVKTVQDTFEGKTVKLDCDIDLKKIPFDPIGYDYESKGGQVFKGIFDGGNHIIYHLYQNGWELDPNKESYSKYTYSTAGAGLFASIKNATIKNLAISGAEVVFECVDMGIVVGYAQGECHFENIVVTDSKIANYNRYTGGLVGEVSGGPYGDDVTNVTDKSEIEYSHTFKNITIDSTVTVSGLWGSFGCGMGGVIGGKWGDATVLMENVISAPEMDVYNDVVSAYQWYAFRGCGMLIGHTEEPYSDGRTSGIATADFLTCENVKVYYGDWVNYTYYEFAKQDSDTGKRYPWVRAEAGEYCEAFSNIRYGVPTHEGVKVSDLTEEELKDKATNYTPIIFDQLYGADRGMYGQAKHEGVEVIYGLGETKTIYIYNDQNWENLKLHYWYRNGEDTWSNVSEDGVSMDNMELSNFANVYRLRLPAYVDGFVITDGTNESEFTLADLENDGIYTLDGAKHEHSYTNGKCECGAYETGKWTLVTDASTLKVGDQIIIVAVSADYAIGITQAANNRPAVAIVKNPDGTVNITENVQILTLVEGITDGTFGLYTGSGYLYAASSSANQLKTQTTNNMNGYWTIKVTDGVASIVAEDSSNRNVMQYNPNNGSPLFACYASASQQAIAIYTLRGNNESVVEPHNCLEYAIDATCENNATCTKCAQVIPNTAFGHNHESVVTEATCTKGGYTTHTCSRCGDDYVTDETDALGHIFDGDSCSVCGEAKPQVGGTKTYVFANYTAGTQYAKNEEHKLDDNTTIVTTECHFTTELRIYSSSTHNGYAIIKSVNPITSIGFNAGDNADTIVIYGSNDNGANWAEVARVEVKSAYADYSAELSTAYTWLKLDVEGSNQVRLKSMTLTTGEPCEHTNTTTNTVAATCTEAGTTTVTCNDCDEVISTENVEALGHTTDNGECDRCGETIGGSTEPAEQTGTAEVKGTTGTKSSDSSSISWTSGDITVTNKKGSTAIRTSDSDHYRVYSGSTVTISVNGGKIKTVVITCTSGSYATVMQTSAKNAGYTATVSGSVVTITLAEGVESITFTASAQTRLNKVEVTYTK